MRTRIPNRFSYKHASVGFAALSLVLLTVLAVINPFKYQILTSLEAALTYTSMAAIIIYLGAEFLNYSDTRRLLEYRYSYDNMGIYRENSPLIRWDEISSIVFVIEVKKDVIPPHRDVVWSPYFNMVKDYSVPELTRKVRVTRAMIYRHKDKGGHPDLIIETTPFLPVFRVLMSRIERLTYSMGLNIDFEIMKLVPEPEKDEEEMPDGNGNRNGT